ncbi:damage-control phosphatase ARMT1 family protein [Pseudodesulfovibrio senegalensis]|jgi:hypothetical protein|uniref:DUF89 family protein n=1 Tax=Pseudodesulfovibrio senegalensis TaxID=1721087 RepID=A0A6N6N621_9BACT|nr:ARMT1-like domain-containing protein [Pseudodesulfovibrio senegalensis]KAB1443690.1 DUF89 family protein [Pseudodesulfovibrio senegalensis]
MKSSLDCLPCFMKLAIRSVRQACPEDENLQLAVVSAWCAKMAELDLTLSPPAIVRELSGLVCEMTGCGDLYAEDKDMTNQQILSMLPDLQALVEKSRSPMLTALELAIIGNFIDRGVEVAHDWREELQTMAETLDPVTVQSFLDAAVPGADVLILGDNAGEIVLDTLLVRELQSRDCNVTYVVRGTPVLNDATLEDAEKVGMTELCTVIDSGVDTPGTVLDRCRPGFLERMEQADVILSKGQGNFEALYEQWDGPVYFAFKVKCPKIAGHTGLDVGQSMFGTAPKL